MRGTRRIPTRTVLIDKLLMGSHLINATLESTAFYPERRAHLAEKVSSLGGRGFSPGAKLPKPVGFSP